VRFSGCRKQLLRLLRRFAPRNDDAAEMQKKTRGAGANARFPKVSFAFASNESHRIEGAFYAPAEPGVVPITPLFLAEVSGQNY
jgi:hypothetical protein